MHAAWAYARSRCGDMHGKRYARQLLSHSAAEGIKLNSWRSRREPCNVQTWFWEICGEAPPRSGLPLGRCDPAS